MLTVLILVEFEYLLVYVPTSIFTRFTNAPYKLKFITVKFAFYDYPDLVETIINR